MSNSLLLKNCSKIITQNPDREILKETDILIEDKEISRIDKIEDEEVETEIDCKNKIVLPGLINTHTHLGGVQYRGYCDDKELFEWIRQTSTVISELDDEEKLSARMISIAKMLESGTTFFNDATSLKTTEAAEKAGIKAMMGQNIFNDMLGVFEADHKDLLEANEEFIKNYQDHDLIYPAVPVHTIYTCTKEALVDSRDQAQKFDVPIHLHLSETEKENQDSLEERGLTPTEYVENLGLLDQHIILAHCVHLSENDEEILKEKDAKIAHCPSSNLKLGSGIADITSLKDKGLGVAVATDSSGSNNHLNLFREARTASILQKRNDPKKMSPQEALDMITIDAAKVLKLEDQIGSIEEGKKADLIVIDENDIEISPYHGEKGLVSNLIYSFDGKVEKALINGDIVLDEGEPSNFEVRKHQGRLQDSLDEL